MGEKVTSIQKTMIVDGLLSIVSRPVPSTVRVRCTTCWHGVYVEYTGPILDLIDCGAIEADMAGVGRKGVRRLDSCGDGFSRRVLPKARLFVQRCITDSDRLRSLPGAYLDEDSEIAQLLVKPEQVIYKRNGGWHNWLGARESLVREGLDLDCANVTVYPGMNGLIKLCWSESDHPQNDPRSLSMRRAEAISRARRMFRKGCEDTPCEVLADVGLAISAADRAVLSALAADFEARFDAFAGRVRIAPIDRPQLRLVR